MVMDSGDLERLAEDMLTQRIITSDAYCAECGYNLRTLPGAGLCPECGSRYNTRPVIKSGIFYPHMIEFPIGDWSAGMLTMAAAVGFTYWGAKPLVPWSLIVAVVFLLLSVLYLRLAWRHTARFLHFRGIQRRADEDY